MSSFWKVLLHIYPSGFEKLSRVRDDKYIAATRQGSRRSNYVVSSLLAPFLSNIVGEVV